jgi:hypothetical protein
LGILLPLVQAAAKPWALEEAMAAPVSTIDRA